MRGERQRVEFQIELGEGVLDRAAERAQRTADSGLAHAFRPERRERGKALLVRQFDHRHLDGGRHRVVHERRGQRLARLVVDDLLVDGAADTLRDPAVEVRVREQRIDDLARVMGEDVAEDLEEPGLRVDLDDAGDRSVRPRGVGAEPALLLRLVVDVSDLEVVRDLERRLDVIHVAAVSVAVGLRGDLGEPERASGCAPDREDALGGLDVFGSHFEHPRGDVGHLPAKLAGGLVRGRPAHDDAPRAVVAEAPRARVGVALDHADAADLASERVGRDLGDRRLVAAAGGGDAGEDHHVAARGHANRGAVVAADHDRARYGCTLRRQLLADPEADPPPFPACLFLELREVPVADQLERPFQDEGVVAAVEHGSGGLRVRERIRLDEVAEPDIRAVAPGDLRHVVDDPIHQERGRVLPIAPVGVPRTLVRHDREELHPDVRDVVDGRQAVPGHERHSPAEQGAGGADVGDHPDLNPRDAPVLLVRRFVGEAGVAGVPADEEVLRALFDPFDRPAELLARVADQRLLLERRLLEAEGSADPWLDHADLRLRQAQRFREVDPQRVRVLRRVPDGEEVLVRVVARQHAARFQRRPRDAVAFDDAAHDPVACSREGLGRLADLEVARDDEVLAPFGLDQRRARLHRLLGIGDRGQLLVVDLDQAERLVRGVPVLCDDSRDGLADEAHALGAEAVPPGALRSDLARVPGLGNRVRLLDDFLAGEHA